MPSLRTQQIANTKNVIFYSDIPINFDMAPSSGDLARLTNENSVNQSLENIVYTVAGERLYQPSIGSTIGMRNFEIGSYFESEILISNLTVDIQQNEPRVNLQNITVVYPADYSVMVTIYYYIVNNPVLQVLSIKLDRTR